jgi:hypothetical protein
VSVLLAAPEPSKGVFSELSRFLLRKPAIPTLLRFRSETEREDYSHRILQRVGVSVERYTILNIHRIGIEVPVLHVFRQLSDWDASSVWWPNHLATVARVNGGLEDLRIIPFGRLAGLPPAAKRSSRPPGRTLFKLKALKISSRPHSADFDNARYLLYECKGGYPIGVFVMYVRSPIAEQDETESAQIFFAVGFDFYGKKGWTRANPVNKLWEIVHNRVTANILNRFKQLCEWEFEDSSGAVFESPRPGLTTASPE